MDIMKEEFRYLISEWLSKKLPRTIERELKINTAAEKVIAIAGVRRCGKTYLIFDIINKLMESGVPKENMLYINFDDDRFQGATTKDLDDMVDVYHEVASPKNSTGIFIFLDEIQNVKNWELWVRRTYDSRKYRIFITGSSSKLLSREIATSLAGRNITYVLYPFSFREFLISNSVKLQAPRSAIDPMIYKYAREYLIDGGFPETALEKDDDTKKRILDSYYNAILYRDVVTRYKVRDANALEMVFRYAINTYSSGFSMVKLHNYFKSQGVDMSRQTINNFIKFGEQTFLFYRLPQFFKGFKRTNQSRKKLYVVDNGIVSLYMTKPEYGRLLENSVYIELLRYKERNPTVEISYLKNAYGEVDFVVSKGGSVLQIIQVTYELGMKNWSRELKPLLEAKRELKPKKTILITFDKVRKEMAVGDGVITMPFTEWCLSQ